MKVNDFNYQDVNDKPAESPVVEQKEVLKQWFPFSRIGMFYFCITVGVNLVAMIIGSVIGVWVTLGAIVGNGGVADVNTAMQSLNEMLMNNIAWVMLIGYAITIPLCMLIAKTIPTYKQERKEKWKVSKLLLFLMISIGVMMAGSFISQIMQLLVKLITGHQMSNPVNDILNSDNILGSMVLTIIIAPIVEEFLFRKVLLDRVRVYGDKIAILLSGILFGLFHGNLFQVVYSALIGMVLAYVYLRTSRIEYCIGLHMMINIIGGALPLVLMRGNDLDAISTMTTNEMMSVAPQLASLGILMMVEMACMIASIVVVIKFRKRIILNAGMIEIEKGQRLKAICLNVGMILFFAVSVVIFITSAMA